MVDVGGHRLETVVLGQGEPTVVFEAGFIGGIGMLQGLQTRIAETTTTVAYERAGLGGSEEGPEPRSADQVARELASLLDVLGMHEPVIVVGHSAGGMFARVFANRYPDRIAGLILVDPATEDAYENWRSSDPTHWDGFEQQVREAHDPPRGWYGQWNALPQSIEEARTAWPLPAVPTTIFTALVPLPEEWVLADDERIEIWRQTHESLSQQTPGAEHVALASVDHVGIIDHPTVSERILNLIDEVRTADESGGEPR
jgi:pimeloyl-ACP methyl ester carboxylesterase